MNKFTLPDLPYGYDALEPYIDAETMKIHHTKHHQAYLDKFNAALETHPELPEMTAEEMLKKLDSLPEDIRTVVRNAGGGYVNHNIFWKTMGPENSRSSKVDEMLVRDFGSVEKFSEDFSASAASLFGSGWTWLVMDNMGKLKIVNTSNQDNPASNEDVRILLALDVWEHAYYLKYQNRRPEYIENWWKVINWSEVEKRMA